MIVTLHNGESVNAEVWQHVKNQLDLGHLIQEISRV